MKIGLRIHLYIQKCSILFKKQVFMIKILTYKPKRIMFKTLVIFNVFSQAKEILTGIGLDLLSGVNHED